MRGQLIILITTLIVWAVWQAIAATHDSTEFVRTQGIATAGLCGLAAVAVFLVGHSERRVKAELKVCRQTEKRLSAILDNMSDGVMVADTTGQMELINASAHAILGLRDSDTSLAERMKTYSVYRADGATPVPVAELPLMRAVTGEHVDNEEIVVRCSARGIDVPISGRARPIFSDTGELEGGVYVFVNISEHKQRERERQRQLDQLKRLTAAAGDLAEALQSSSRESGLSDDSTVLATIAKTLECDWAAIAMFHQKNSVDWRSVLMTQEGSYMTSSRIVLESTQWSEILPNDLSIQPQVMSALTTPQGTIRNVAVVALVHRGRVRGAILVGLRTKPYSDDDLDVLRRMSQMASAAVSIRRSMEKEQYARIRAEEKLTASLTKLERLNQENAVGEMTTSIAHELSQPLTAMINYSDAAKSLASTDFSEETCEELQMLTRKTYENALHAADIVQSVRSLIRQQISRATRFDVLDVVRDTLELLEKEIHLTHATVHVKNEASERQMMGEQTQIQQLVFNLAQNALHAVAEQSERNIDITLFGQGGQIVLSVADTGTGIEEQDLDRLFDAFFTTREHGLGFGLRICRSIVELHGGQIRAANRDTGGAIFTVVLPLENRRQGAT